MRTGTLGSEQWHELSGWERTEYLGLGAHGTRGYLLIDGGERMGHPHMLGSKQVISVFAVWAQVISLPLRCSGMKVRLAGQAEGIQWVEFMISVLNSQVLALMKQMGGSLGSWLWSGRSEGQIQDSELALVVLESGLYEKVKLKLFCSVGVSFSPKHWDNTATCHRGTYLQDERLGRVRVFKDGSGGEGGF